MFLFLKVGVLECFIEGGGVGQGFKQETISTIGGGV